MSDTRTLRLLIELPGFYAADCESGEDAEVSMALSSDDVIVVFQGTEGDRPGVVLRSLEGRIKRVTLSGVGDE